MTERGTTPGRDPRPGLSFDDHRRDGADRTMVYPVMSRRAGGLSIGVNLNLGQECNWACVYCEVEGLVRGAPGPVDLARLEQELDAVLTEASSGRWSNGTTGEGLPAEIKDISIAGDGEPTLSPQFDGAVEVCARLRQQHGLEGSARLVVITNGSRLHVPEERVRPRHQPVAQSEPQGRDTRARRARCAPGRRRRQAALSTASAEAAAPVPSRQAA